MVDSRKAAAMAGEYKRVFAAVGVHPHSMNIRKKLSEALFLFQMRKVVAVGRSDWIFTMTFPRETYRSLFLKNK